MLLTPQLEPFLPLDPQTFCTWRGANSATRPLATTFLLNNIQPRLMSSAMIVMNKFTAS